MIDTTTAMPVRTSTLSAELVAKRYRTERRFRAYGLVSLCITALFLLFLVIDIVSKGYPAYFEHTASLPVTISAEKIDSAAPGKGDYLGLAKDALKQAFPAFSNRTDRKALLSLLSSGAADDLRVRVISNPALIGQKLDVPLLLSADADLYLKGSQTGVIRAVGKGPIDITQAGDKYTVSGSIDGLEAGTVLRANGGAFRIKVASAASLDAELLVVPTAIGSVPGDRWQSLFFSKPEADRRISDKEAVVLETLKEQGVISKGIAWRFFTSGDSREPELSGIRGALVGSLLTIAITLAICLPIGIATAIYLEEFAGKGRMTDFIEVNINNLAAVPSIIFGLLGLAVFLNFFGMPRSAPIVGGLVLALLVLPTIIIASRAALRSVPPSIKEAALGVGASHQQAVFHHVLPLAVPGILTGTILGVSRALGETAPLLMIGMVAFIVDVPAGITDAATLLPVQIYLWSDLPEIGFQSRTAAAIILLMFVLFGLNGAAIYLRKRFERRW
jgi:phosphate transport system permease protein